MKCLRLLWVSVFIFSFQFFENPISRINFENSFNDSNMEFSSLAMIGNSFITATERKGKIYSFKLVNNMLVYDKEFPIPTAGGDGDSQFEAVTTYKNLIILSDEKNTRIIGLDSLSNDIKLNFQNNDLFPFEADQFGIEGVAINEKMDMLYILKERCPSDSTSVIFGFNFKEIIDNKFDLSFKFKHIIDNKICNDNNFSPKARYSDICFDSTSNYLYAIKSYYSRYSICKFKIDGSSGSINSGCPIDSNISTHVSSFNRLEDLYNTNLEGIWIHKDSIYLISDNGTGKKTLFLKMKKF